MYSYLQKTWKDGINFQGIYNEIVYCHACATYMLYFFYDLTNKIKDYVNNYVISSPLKSVPQ